MRSDGKPLPDPSEAAALVRMDLLLSSDLPDIAARWLAVDLVDTEAVRTLAGEDRNAGWSIDRLMERVLVETGSSTPEDPLVIQSIAVDWVTSTWRDTGDTQWAVSTLAHLGETHLDFDLGLFIGLDDEWNGGWGRLEADLKAAAMDELGRLTHGTP